MIWKFILFLKINSIKLYPALNDPKIQLNVDFHTNFQFEKQLRDGHKTNRGFLRFNHPHLHLPPRHPRHLPHPHHLQRLRLI